MTQPSQRVRRDAGRGFTLIELQVATAIMAILIQIAACRPHPARTVEDGPREITIEFRWLEEIPDAPDL